MDKPKRLSIIREDRTIEIPLTQGLHAVVDWEDVWVCGYNWHALTTPTGHTYAVRRGILMHRVILGLEKRNGIDVDHKNGDTLDCRRVNLRAITHAQNLRNRKLNSNNTSGHAGVSLKDGLWYARLSTTHLGCFKTLEEAVAVRLQAERESWGVHPRRAKHYADDLV